MCFNVFAYNDLLLENTLNILRIKPVSVQFGETQGRLYLMHNQTMLIVNEKILRLSGRRVIGAIYTFKDEDERRILDVLDTYHGCSLSRIGLRNPYDSTYRSVVDVIPLVAESKDKLYSLSFLSIKPTVRCYAWIGNESNKHIRSGIHRKRNLYGLYKHGLNDTWRRLYG